MTHVVRTACTRDCPDACQILATVENSRIVALRGDPAHPITRGFLCYRTDHYLERQYSSERVTTPLVRRGRTASTRGQEGRDGLVPATWDEALDLVAAQLRDARDRFGASSILHYQSGGSLGLLKLLNRHFFELLGPVTHKRGDICSGAGDAAQMADMGHEDAHDLDDLDNARSILLWGKNVAETGVHLIPRLKRARARGATIVGIDPVFNAKTAALTDRFYSVRPGGDGYLALGMARAVFDAGIEDRASLDRCDGEGAFRALAGRHSVAGWAELAGVEPSVIHDLVDVYARAKPATLFVGWGLARRRHGSATVRLLDALGAITGNIGVPGGGVSYYFARRGGFDTSFIKRPENAGARTLLEPLLGEEILRADPKLRVAVIDNGNPVSMLPDSKTVARAISSIDFVVVLDAFLTDTAELADVVLPTTTMLEEHDVVGAYGHSWVQLAQPVVPPPEGVRSDLDIYRALAERLGFGARLSGTAEEYIDRLLAPMNAGGVTRESLAKSALRKPAAPRVLFEDRVYPTPTQRFQLVADFAAAPAPRDPAYPLELMSISSYRTQASQVSRASQLEELPTAWIHPDAAPGIPDGAEAILASVIHEAPVRVKHDPKLRPDIVLYPKGRWGSLGGPNAFIRARETDAGGGAAYYDEGVTLKPARGRGPLA
ncbi:MAG: molybdopterin-dependent oxidoreductase [Polyangiaceae bacterium]